MLMTRYFVCCEECFERIGKRNTRAARLWMDLCAMRLATNEVFTIKTLDFPELRTLELLGYIVSTEKPKSIALRVKGLGQTTEGEHFFCLQGGRHERA